MPDFVQRIKIASDKVEMAYVIPMESDGAMIDSEFVLGTFQSSPPSFPRARTLESTSPLGP